MPENREMTTVFGCLSPPHPYVGIYPLTDCGKPRPVHVQKKHKAPHKTKGIVSKTDAVLIALVRAA